MRVLLVEDDATTAAGIKMMLGKENFICDTTDLGEDGLEIGKLYDYDIILLDLMLPDIDGYEVLRRLRVARVRTPILILSGLAEHHLDAGRGCRIILDKKHAHKNLRVRPVTRTDGAFVNQDYRQQLTTRYRRAESMILTQFGAIGFEIFANRR